MFRDGTRAPLTLRREEILALLDSRAQGWTAEEMAYELYRDAGTTAAISTVMYRVRSMLGSTVESNPYRFDAVLAAARIPGAYCGCYGRDVSLRHWTPTGLPCSAVRGHWRCS